MGIQFSQTQGGCWCSIVQGKIGQKMGGGYNWTWPQIPSLTAMKYQRHGYVEARPFLPGERLSGRKGCERNVKGYHELRQSLDRERKIMAAAMAPPEPKGEVQRIGFYKSLVGARTSRLSGGLYHSFTVSRIGYFSSV